MIRCTNVSVRNYVKVLVYEIDNQKHTNHFVFKKKEYIFQKNINLLKRIDLKNDEDEKNTN